MAENGKDIEAGKAKLEEEQRLRQAAEQAVKDRDKQIADLSKEIGRASCRERV